MNRFIRSNFTPGTNITLFPRAFGISGATGGDIKLDRLILFLPKSSDDLEVLAMLADVTAETSSRTKRGQARKIARARKLGCGEGSPPT